MDLTALTTRASFRYRDTLNRRITAAEWATYLQEGYEELAASSPFWPWLQTVTTISMSAGTYSSALPEFAGVNSVFNDTDNFPLEPIQGENQVHDWFPDPSTQGMPAYYRVYQGLLWVYPAPAATTSFLVEHRGDINVLSTGTDVPRFADRFHSILVYAALAKAYEDDGDDKAALRYRTQHDRLATQMLMYYLQPQQEGYPTITDNA